MAENPTDNWQDNWEEYEKARVRNDQIHGEYLRTFSQRSYEYGLLSVKNLTLISGGAIVAMPAIAGLSEQVPASVAANAGMWFVGSLLLSVACTYVIHLNWSANYGQRDAEYDRDHARVVRQFLPFRAEEYLDDAAYYRASQRHYRIAWWTYLGGHLVGVFAYVAFFVACWKLLGAFTEGAS